MISWTPIEQDLLIADAAFELARQGVTSMPDSDDRVGGSIILEAVRAAQNRTLYIGRRRSLTGRNCLGAVFLNKLARALKQPPERRPDPIYGKKPETHVAQESPELKPVETSVEQTAIQVSTPSVLSSCSDAELCREFFDRMLAGRDRKADARVDALEKELQTLKAEIASLREVQAKTDDYQSLITEEMSVLSKRVEDGISLITEAVPVKAEEPKPIEAKPPTVAIVGCQKYEFDRIVAGADAMGLNLNFAHYDQEENPKAIVGEYALVMKWASHKWNNQAKTAVSKDRFAFISGGTTMALKQLVQWFSN